MSKLTIVDRSGNEKTVEGTPGWSVMENVRDTGFDELLALCGGACSCATCHVHVDPAWITAVGRPNADEDDLLDACGHKTAESRLSCQIMLTEALSGLCVRIAPEH